MYAEVTLGVIVINSSKSTVVCTCVCVVVCQCTVYV